jgi:hypothetical protein
MPANGRWDLIRRLKGYCRGFPSYGIWHCLNGESDTEVLRQSVVVILKGRNVEDHHDEDLLVTRPHVQEERCHKAEKLGLCFDFLDKYWWCATVALTLSIQVTYEAGAPLQLNAMGSQINLFSPYWYRIETICSAPAKACHRYHKSRRP